MYEFTPAVAAWIDGAAIAYDEVDWLILKPKKDRSKKPSRQRYNNKHSGESKRSWNPESARFTGGKHSGFSGKEKKKK